MKPPTAISYCALALGIMLAACRGQEAQPHKRPPLDHFKGAKPTPVTGVPAIPTTKGAVPGQAAFSADDARSFVQSHTVPGSLPKLNRLDRVESVQFLREDEAAKSLDGERIGGPPDRMVCLVIISGEFAFSAPGKQTLRFPRAIEVFDAQTGNFLLSSGLPNQTEAPKR